MKMSKLNQLNRLSSKLSELIINNSQQVKVPKNTEVMREGQLVKSIPIVIRGLVKVYTRHEDKELLLYYIQPNESCIMSFDAGINQSASRIYATTEEDSTVLLMPAEKISRWLTEYPELNQLFFSQYNARYVEMIDMILQVMFEKMDKRVYDYLKAKSELKQQNPIKISHRSIATDLGTVREVITRILKKLELEHKISQDSGFITIM